MLQLIMMMMLLMTTHVHSYQPSVEVVPKSSQQQQQQQQPNPRVIQGGMGIRISKWSLAREVSTMGQLGVVSGTAMDTILVRELQDGDKDGSVRRALSSFPDQGMVRRVLDKYYNEGGRDAGEPYRSLPMWTVRPSQHLLEVCVLANYCEVWLAKHRDDGTPTDGLVGINLLTKVQLPTVPSLYGAILAGVDYVIMGAGKKKNERKKIAQSVLASSSLHSDLYLPIDTIPPWFVNVAVLWQAFQ